MEENIKCTAKGRNSFTSYHKFELNVGKKGRNIKIVSANK